MGVTRNPDPAIQPGRGPHETIRVPLRRVRVLIHVASLRLRARVHYRLHPWSVEILLLLEVGRQGVIETRGLEENGREGFVASPSAERRIRRKEGMGVSFRIRSRAGRVDAIGAIWRRARRRGGLNDRVASIR